MLFARLRIYAREREAGVGAPAPQFVLSKTDGTKILLDDLKGKPPVLVFWSAYCSSCKKEAPKLNQLTAEYAAKGVRVIGVNIDANDARMNEGVKDFGIEYEYARDQDTAVAQAFKVVGTPTVIFLDQDGKISYSGNKLPDDYAVRLDSMTSGI